MFSHYSGKLTKLGMRSVFSSLRKFMTQVRTFSDVADNAPLENQFFREFNE
jgi:hypothetical protein